MPVYNFKGRGRRGYSGANPVAIGNEVFAQSTFTPAYDLWVITPDCDFSFVDNKLVYTDSNGWGEVSQNKTDFLSPYTDGQQYRFEWVLQNVSNVENLHAEIDDANYEKLADLQIVNGRSSVLFTANSDDATLYIYVENGDSGGSFEILSMSLKSYEEAPQGESGYSGVAAGNAPEYCEQVHHTHPEILVADFNTLLDELREKGWMEEGE
jgi:hypothetical protein